MARCEPCHGTGRRINRGIHVTCGECGGSGRVHCCEGEQAQPDLTQLSFDDATAYQIELRAIQDLVWLRVTARAVGEFAIADEARDCLLNKYNVRVEDHRDGSSFYHQGDGPADTPIWGNSPPALLNCPELLRSSFEDAHRTVLNVKTGS